MLLEVAGRRILLSGDLGRPDDLIMNSPSEAPAADTVMMHTTHLFEHHQGEHRLRGATPQTVLQHGKAKQRSYRF